MRILSEPPIMWFKNCNDFDVLACFKSKCRLLLNLLETTYYLNNKFLLLEPSPSRSARFYCILRNCWTNLKDCFGLSKRLKQHWSLGIRTSATRKTVTWNNFGSDSWVIAERVLSQLAYKLQKWGFCEGFTVWHFATKCGALKYVKPLNAEPLLRIERFQLR